MPSRERYVKNHIAFYEHPNLPKLPKFCTMMGVWLMPDVASSFAQDAGNMSFDPLLGIPSSCDKVLCESWHYKTLADPSA